ncbi:hypothetical protein PVNG_03083, partial [Plasmodium vivax North Korean]
IPSLGLIFPILFGINRKISGILGLCSEDNFDTNNDNKDKTTVGYVSCSAEWIHIKRILFENVEYVNMLFSIIMITIVLFVIIYILIKFIKYEKIKAGKGKMSIKECCRFCKDIF